MSIATERYVSNTVITECSNYLNTTPLTCPCTWIIFLLQDICLTYNCLLFDSLGLLPSDPPHIFHLHSAPQTHCTHPFWLGRVHLRTWNVLFCSIYCESCVCDPGVSEHCCACEAPWLTCYICIWVVCDNLCWGLQTNQPDAIAFCTGFICPHLWACLNFRVFWI